MQTRYKIDVYMPDVCEMNMKMCACKLQIEYCSARKLGFMQTVSNLTRESWNPKIKQELLGLQCSCTWCVRESNSYCSLAFRKEIQLGLEVKNAFQTDTLWNSWVVEAWVRRKSYVTWSTCAKRTQQTPPSQTAHNKVWPWSKENRNTSWDV